MPQHKKYRRPRPINETLLHEWELDAPKFAVKAKDGVSDETTRAAIDALAEFLVEVIGEVRRVKAKMAGIASDNTVMRKRLDDYRLRIRGIRPYEGARRR